MEKLISVIIPIYNVEKYLERCIESVVKQTYQNLDIVLVDDGSPDQCPEICDRWKEKDSRIQVIHKKNGGLSDARNAGMQSAKGEFVVYVDSDDWIHKDMISVLAGIQQEMNADIVECRAVRTTGYIEDTVVKQEDTGILEFGPEAALEALQRENPLKQTVWNKLYRKSLIQDIKFEKGRVHEDEFWTYQVLAASKKTVFADIELYYYFQREGSIMGQAFSLKRLDAIEGRYRKMKFLEEKYPGLGFEAKKNLLFLILYYGQQAIREAGKAEQKSYFESIKRYLNELRFSAEERQKLRIIERVWILFAGKNAEMTCKMRNRMGIGIN